MNSLAFIIAAFLSVGIMVLFVLYVKAITKSRNYHSLIDYSSDWIWQVNSNLEFSYSNHGVENILGYKNKEVIGTYPYDYVPEWERNVIIAKIQEHLQSQSPLVSFQTTAKHANDSLVFLETNAIPFYKNNKFSGLRGVTRDITESKLKEKKIEAQQVRLDLAQESANMGIWDWKVESRQVFFNPAYYTMLGYQPYQFPSTYKTWESLLHPDDLVRSTAYVTSFLHSDNDLFEIEFRLKNNAGDYAWILSRGKVTERDFKGKISRIVGIHIDISSKKGYEEFITNYNRKLEKKVEERTVSLLEANRKLQEEIGIRKKAENALIQSETFFINLIENLPEPVFVINSKEQVIIHNKNYMQLFATNGNSNDYPSYISQFPEYISINIRLAHKKLQTQDDIHSFDAVIQQQETKKHLVFYLNKLSYYEGEVLLLGIIRDISEVKKAEKELSQALKMEKELNSLRTQFISTVSHEFRTPLAGIRNVVLMIHRFYDKWSREKRDEKINQVFQSIDSMKLMLDDISLLGKEISGRLGFHPVETNLKQLLEGIKNEIINISPNQRIALTFKENHIPPTVYLDKTLLRQVLINLLNNAVKYSEKDDVIQFETGQVKDKNMFYFVIEDHGIGIPFDELQNIFLPFYRASNARNKKGTGLGMAIVQKFTEIQKGTVSITSIQGKGTTVRVEIPYDLTIISGS